MSHRRLAPAALLAAFAAGCSDATPVAPTPASRPGPRATVADAGPGRYIVALAADRADALAAALQAAGGHVVDSIPAIGAVVVEGVADPAALAVDGVRYAEPDGWFTADPVEVVPRAAAVDGDVEPRADEPGPASTNPSGAPWFANGVQWDMQVVRADRVWGSSAGGANVNTCIVDSGLDDQHQELAGKMVASASFVPNDPANPGAGFSPVRLDSAGHGTHVASTVSGNGRVMASVAPDTRLMAAKVLAANNAGQWSWILNGMAWCADNGAHVLNASLGGRFFFPAGVPPESSPVVQALADVVQYARDRGVVAVISAGNSNVQIPNPSQYFFPAQVPGAIVVGATGPVTRMVGQVVGGLFSNTPVASPPAWNPADPTQVWQGPDGRAFYSNFGPAIDVFAPGGRGGVPASFPRRVALVAPGTVRSIQGGVHDNVWAACSRFSLYAGAPNVGGVPGAFGGCANASDRYASLAGTSMAAPHVSGIAAILYSEIGGPPSAAARARVEACLRSTTDVIGPSSVFGGGRVNAERAVAAVRAGAC